ncbi:Stk1 family PASTA domain-containing Ser/Thr kinase [Salimicrobium salexigens]|uniref:non-specific serine/threonine protein kinase n=1 Tax=Salimicrobium salexigens TaxID=908941 RepID=A0ABY1KPQ9_9BACI|nr:Stk1 family PASTA domain-containing Ser/Thr kinase [Salimicrobium salexigens]SIS62352.1 serine/threonine protein kinase [Salimicrobium salexigens]
MLENQWLNDRYLVKEMIGGGGMAYVYLAFDTVSEQEVAVKVLRMEYGEDEEFIARFHREAQASISLNHPNIVNIFDVGEEQGIYYMVMELIEGMTLKKYIQYHSPVDPAEAVGIMRQITEAMDYAHANGLIHRDIKPQNILISPQGTVKVTDFGIAMALSSTALTQTNSVLGSVHYLSPEQARGGTATRRSDIYSLGIVLFELLTGRLPFSGESPVSVALKHLQHDTPSISKYTEVPQSIENIVLKATAKNPLHRYSEVEEMDEDLSRCLTERNPAPFKLPEEEGEETKAIPVVTEDYRSGGAEETLRHAGGKPLREKKRKKGRVWIIAFIIFLFIGGGAAVAVPMVLGPKEVEVADVTGMEYEDAYSTLLDSSLQVERGSAYSDDVEEGDVIQISPSPGSRVPEETEVTVVSSRGKRTVKISDYTGEDFRAAKKTLEEKGFTSVFSIHNSSERPAGEILEQLQPAADRKVIPGETSVLFRVSSGPPKVLLRPLRGMSEDKAREYLEGEGMKMKVEEQFSGEVEAGKIVSQSPDAFSEIERGTKVTISLSLGQKEKPMKEKTLTFDLPYTGENGEEETYQIFLKDANTKDEEVFLEKVITEEKTVEIDVQIREGEEAVYRVEKHGDIVKEGKTEY